jgi:hypothetical protein
MRGNLGVMFAMILAAVGSWSIDRPLVNWSDILWPSQFLSLAGAIGVALLAWLKQSPVTPKVPPAAAPATTDSPVYTVAGKPTPRR